MTHLAFELRTSTPDSLAADLAERVEASGYRSLRVNHSPDEDGLGHLATMAAATTRITLGTYAAHFSRTGVKPEQTWIAAGELGELPGLLEPWRDTVDEVVLVPVSAAAPGPARDLVDAAIAAF
ncbi:MAG: hypothetical protein ACRDPF_21545 [Streptosporangiaceae bacterium]